MRILERQSTAKCAKSAKKEHWYGMRQISMSNEIELIATEIVDAAFKVHKELGPGLLESAYQQCHSYELRKRGRKVLTELVVPIIYDGQHIDAGYRIDMLVEDLIIVENKTVENVLPIHKAQLITYLKLKDCKLGFLINWNVKLIKNGITRVANGIEETSWHIQPTSNS
jgi:GxxExxY protein